MRLVIELEPVLYTKFAKELGSQFPTVILRNALANHAKRLAIDTKPQVFASLLSKSSMRVEK